MTLLNLTTEEREVVRRSMQASLLFIGAGFDARMGLEETTMSALLKAWPDLDDSDDNSITCLAINNALNDLLHGVGISDEQAMQTVGVNRDEMYRVYKKWAIGRGWSSTGVR